MRGINFLSLSRLMFSYMLYSCYLSIQAQADLVYSALNWGWMRTKRGDTHADTSYYS
jgi:hypothetical protein